MAQIYKTLGCANVVPEKICHLSGGLRDCSLIASPPSVHLFRTADTFATRLINRRRLSMIGLSIVKTCYGQVMLRSIAKPRKTHESVFVDSFLKTANPFSDSRYNLVYFKEVHADGTIPDIIVAQWHKDRAIKWSRHRDNLEKQDLKILHFLSTYGRRGASMGIIERLLGFAETMIEKSLEKLVQAEVAELTRTGARSKALDEIFFLKEIIAIEAKLGSYKQALGQAQLNGNFSSMSYILVPQLTPRLPESVRSNDIGLLTFDGSLTTVHRSSKRQPIPVSTFSWMVNEHVGRMISTN